MENFSVILNTGIQYYRLEEEVTIDLNQNVMKALRFFEMEFNDKIYLDPVYYFPMKDKYLRRNDLITGGYLDPVTNEMAPEEVINPNMNWLDDTQLLSINRLNVTVGDKKLSGLEQIENRWLPLPFYESDVSGASTTPNDWCRIKLKPVKEKCTAQKRVYNIVIALDTNENLVEENSSPHFNGQPFKTYSLCGISSSNLETLSDKEQRTIKSILVPLKAYEFCDHNKQPWLNSYLQEMLNCTDLMQFEPGQRMKYLAYYAYFISYIHNLNIIPEVKLFNDCGQAAIHTNLVLDVGNSRTFGLVAEDPLNISFSKSSVIELRDLETGDVYADPFDMRLCFKEERFGFSTGGGQFKWPSIVRLGKEAMRNIYDGEQDLLSGEVFDTSHSSPKRYLWDKKAFSGQWKFVSEKDRIAGPAPTAFIDGLQQQFLDDGTFTPDPAKMGEFSSYSRSSLMTFCFIEILLQAKMQINSTTFRKKNGNESTKREITRVILTCPTAMTREEQITLRKCMEEASIVLHRYYSKTYNIPYDPDQNQEKVEIVPSVKDLTRTVSTIDNKRNWNYDEATCCQMVYMYSELRRYLGNAREFFGLYGKKRNNEPTPSLTVASLDIGAGTSDIMICNYKEEGESIIPTPLFWESFHTAGDELIKRIIIDVIIESPIEKYKGASGVITDKLQSMQHPDIANTKHHFFGDGHKMGVIEKRMRKEFSIQVLFPIANYLLDLLQRNEEDRVLTYEDFFGNGNRPAQSLMDFFAKQFGFRFEDLTIKYSKEFMNEIVRRVFEPSLRKWAAIFYSYKCDIVLLGGRPCSLQQIYSMLLRLYPVTPNHLVSMNEYRVGSWYLGSSDIGEFGDRKSLVAVGALIAYLAENGKLSMFKLTTDNLKTKILPTTEYIGLLNPHTGTLSNILTPEINFAPIDISAFPQSIGSKQVDVPGYPAQQLYVLDFDNNVVRTRAIENLKKQMGLPQDTPEEGISPDYIANEVETIKFRLKQNVPLTFQFEREYNEDKEKIKIDSVVNSARDEISSKMFALSLQSWIEDESNWLDTGKYIMHIS